jgi:hypothetical protein
VVCGFYRTCVIDGVLQHSPAEWLRRPTVPAESPTLGLTHLQFEVLLTAARESTNINDVALIAMLGLLGLRIFEACAADIAASARSPATASCGWSARAARSSSCRCRRPSGGRSSAPSTNASPGRCCGPAGRPDEPARRPS